MIREEYQRKKLRDLFDMDYAIQHADINRDDVLRCWQKYMALKGGEVPTQEDIIANMDAKLVDPDYLNYPAALIR